MGKWQAERLIAWIGLCLLMQPDSGCGQEKLMFPFASMAERRALARDLRREIDATTTHPFPGSDERPWSKAFWAMTLMGYHPPAFAASIPQMVSHLPKCPPGLQRDFLEMLYTLFPGEYSEELEKVCFLLGNARNKTMALEYLANRGRFPEPEIQDALRSTGWWAAFRKRWDNPRSPAPDPDIYLHPQFLPGQRVLLSFQYTNRDKPGFLMLRRADGTWQSNAEGQPLRFPQLARSVSGLPYYLTNGNTPQGLYRVTGFGQSDNPWIGPTTNLQMLLPFENPKIYAPEREYATLLEPLINLYPGLWEAWEAGKLGRSEIIAHGSTIDPSFYRGTAYFPCTPSLGCLCSPEIWDKRGKRVSSTQKEWIGLLQEEPSLPLWLVVAEIAGNATVERNKHPGKKTIRHGR